MIWKAMLGGAWYEEYIENKTPTQIYDMALTELQKHLGFKIDPDLHDLTILPHAIPQYKVGHQQLHTDNNECMKVNKLNEKLFLIGNTYDGIGVNDAIFNSRKLIQNLLNK